MLNFHEEDYYPYFVEYFIFIGSIPNYAQSAIFIQWAIMVLTWVSDRNTNQ